MSEHIENIEEQQNKPKNIIGYINFDKENSDELFRKLNEFRKTHGIKYSHQSKRVYFNIKSELLNEFSNVSAFTISRDNNVASYMCDKQTADKLIEQKDSFIRLNWDEINNLLIIKSRTPKLIQKNLLKRIFTDAKVNFNELKYSDLNRFYKNQNEYYNNKEHQMKYNKQVEEQEQEQEQTPTPTPTPTPTLTLIQIHSTNQHDGFQQIPLKKSKKTATQLNSNFNSNTDVNTNTNTDVNTNTNTDVNTNTNTDVNTNTNTDVNVKTTTKIIKAKEIVLKPKVRGAKTAKN